MAKMYTAQQMRDEAMSLYELGHSAAPAMLRQAADLIEREEKRDKKYEYSLRYSRLNGVSKLHEDDFALLEKLNPNTIILRRPVGEWEEVKE